MLQLPLSYETQEATSASFIASISQNPWVHTVEMMTTIGQTDVPVFCEKISKIPEQIQIFGGGALATDVYDGHSADTFVFSSEGDYSSNGIVFLLYGGEDLHTHTEYVAGWRGLGLPFEVTASERNILKELDGKPAFSQYFDFLHVPTDEHFFEMAVVFPFSFEEDGVPYLRVATAFHEDASMILGADIKQGSTCRIAYGDPQSIIAAVQKSVDTVQAFAPQMIRLYSCGSRQYFWGREVGRETGPFNQIASTSGFFTSGEFLRTGQSLVLHNVILAVAALREGEPAEKALEPVTVGAEKFSRQIRINNCLTSFINAATRQLEDANIQLSRMAITDGLTNLFNRAEIERRIRKALESYQKEKGDVPPIAIMIDLDHFKRINDTYGHLEGDEVLKKASEIFTTLVEKHQLQACVGRWGGEEFMFLLENTTLEEASALAEDIRTSFAACNFPHSGTHTLSAGITMARKSDTMDTFSNRADKGLYLAKEDGRNHTVVVSII